MGNSWTPKTLFLIGTMPDFGELRALSLTCSGLSGPIWLWPAYNGIGQSLRNNMFDEINTELLRIKACEIGLSAIERLGSPKHSFIKVSLGSRSCTISASGFLEMLKSLPDGATEASVQAALEMSSEHAESWATA